ncbi:MAG: hypothetical protein IPM82_11320 [Saprospiraceae bacterium]|nr:hypothetical protein [Saprospiraceae bacterium]
MKKVNFKSMLTALSVALTLLFVGIGSAGAQSDMTSSPLTIPQGSFVDANQAQVILGEQLDILKDQLSVLQIGDPIYTAVEIKYVYYQEIDNALKSGSTVSSSIVQGLAPFMTEAYDLTSTQVTQLKQDAIDLLSI